MQGIEVSGSFEDAAAQASDELRAVDEMAEALVDRIAETARSKMPPDGAALEAFDDACRAITARRKVVHATLAGQVLETARVIDGAAAALDEQDVPRRSDRMLGYVSRDLMRRRMAGRSGRAFSGQRLLLALGRCDRLAGIVETHRSVARGQRDRAEASLSGFFLRGDGEEFASSGEGDVPLRGHADAGTAQARERAALSFSELVDALNAAIRDQTVLLQKLTFDVEHALETYNVLTDMGLVRETLPEPQAYPHFTRSIERFAGGILPGGRLAQARQAAERVFAERFAAG